MLQTLLLALALAAAPPAPPTVADKAQDRAVVKDQGRQDVADQAESNKQNAENTRQDVKVAVDNRVQDKQIERIAASAISDRQFMAILIGCVVGLLVALWLLLHNGLRAIRETLAVIGNRTVELEAHIEETRTKGDA